MYRLSSYRFSISCGFCPVNLFFEFLYSETQPKSQIASDPAHQCHNSGNVQELLPFFQGTRGCDLEMMGLARIIVQEELLVQMELARIASLMILLLHEPSPRIVGEYRIVIIVDPQSLPFSIGLPCHDIYNRSQYSPLKCRV